MLAKCLVLQCQATRALNAVCAVLEVSHARQAAAVMSVCDAGQRCLLASSSGLPGTRPPPPVDSDVLELQSSVISSVANLSTSAKHGAGTAFEGRCWSHINLSLQHISASFNRADLSAADFSGATLRKCSFNCALLNSCSFVDASLHTCTFIGAEMLEVDARNGRFANCIFHRCDMRRWKADGAVFLNCDFKNCDFSSLEFNGQTMFVRPLSWSSSQKDDWRQSQHSLGAHGERRYQLLSEIPAARV